MSNYNTILIAIFFVLSIYFIYRYYNISTDQNCFNKCADYHISGDSLHWDYNDYIIDNLDTIWIDKECYNEWCICIDECKPGLCCKLLN